MQGSLALEWAPPELQERKEEKASDELKRITALDTAVHSLHSELLKEHQKMAVSSTV